VEIGSEIGAKIQVSSAPLIDKLQTAGEVFMRPIFFALALLFAGRLFAGPAVVESVKVKTKAPSNAELTVYYRVPKDYNPDKREASRILVLFGGRNSTGSFLGSGALGFGEWADRLGIFLVAFDGGLPVVAPANYSENIDLGSPYSNRVSKQTGA